MPLISQADIRTDILSKISELSQGDIILQEIAVEIAESESNFEPKAKNSRSSASGIFQYIKSTWRENCEGDVWNYEDNIACGVRMLADGRFRHWEATRAIWYPKLSSGAKWRVNSDIAGDRVGYRMVSFAGGKVYINHKGAIINKNGGIFKGGEIPYI